MLKKLNSRELYKGKKRHYILNLCQLYAEHHDLCETSLLLKHTVFHDPSTLCWNWSGPAFNTTHQPRGISSQARATRRVKSEKPQRSPISASKQSAQWILTAESHRGFIKAILSNSVWTHLLFSRNLCHLSGRQSLVSPTFALL